MLDDAALDRKAEKLAEHLFETMCDILAWSEAIRKEGVVTKHTSVDIRANLKDTIKEIMLGART